MSTQANPDPKSLESWERKEAIIRAERAEEFARLSPEEQQKILAEEKKAFEQSRQKLRADLGYGSFDQDAAKKPALSPEAEEQEKALAAREMEQKLSNPEPPGRPAEKKEHHSTVDLPKFLALFDAARENIARQKPFEYQSVALDDFGRPVSQRAYMRGLFDHSQQLALDPDKIRQNVLKGKTRPEQISLDIEVDMGEQGDNSLGLTNLRLRLSLASLAEGQLLEKLARFTNMVYFAAHLHDRQKKLPVSGKEKEETGPVSPQHIEIEKQKRQFKFGQLAADGGLRQSDGLFTGGNTGTVAFAINNGAVWGTFETHGAPSSPLVLQEALDKINLEK